MWSGTGTETDPYLISTVRNLQDLSTVVNNNNDLSSDYFKLTQDLDLSTVCGANLNDKEVSWTPIGHLMAHAFDGHFDGDGHKISNLYINDPNGSPMGLFGAATNATIKNLYVDGIVTGQSYVAGILGMGTGITITNCHSNVTINGNELVGGIAGDITGTIEYCSNTGSVSATSEYAGGVVGCNSNGTVTSCFNTGTVTDSSNYVGGVVGCNYNGTVTSCFNAGTVVGGSNYVGGVTGYNRDGCTVTNCYYLTGTAEGGINKADEPGQAEVKTADQFASGEVAHLLQGNQEASAWGQTLSGESTDTNPVLLTSLGTEQQAAKRVHKLTFNTDATSSTVLYANPGGVGADRIPALPAAEAGYTFKWAESETAPAFTGTTPITADMTLNAYQSAASSVTPVADVQTITDDTTEADKNSVGFVGNVKVIGTAPVGFKITATTADNTTKTATWTIPDGPSVTSNSAEGTTIVYGLIITDLSAEGLSRDSVSAQYLQ